MTTETMDPAKAEAFAGQMIGMLNGAMTTLMVSVGHRTGLFDKLATMPPATSEEIAQKTGLNERYVREWLGNMTTARVIEHDPAKGTYSLPPEHAASITRAAGPGNLAAMAEFMALMGNVEDGIVEAFQKGGGVPYSGFPKFQQLMAAGERADLRRDADRRDACHWRTWAPSSRQGIDVADVGCGQGHAINLMAKAYPKSRFTGFDFSKEGVAAGKAEAKALGTVERVVRGEGRHEPWRLREVRPHHGVRCDPRPGAAAQGAEGHLRRAQAGRRVPDGRHRRRQHARRQHGAPAGADDVRHLDVPLHDGLARPRR